MRTIALLVMVSLIALASLTACYSSSGASSGDEPPPDPSAAAGKTLAGALGCAGCHGADLAGGVGPNLTADMTTGLGTWSDGQIVAAIRTGVDDEGAGLCSSMPRFGALDDEQAAELVAFLRALPSISRDVPSACGDGDVLSDAGLDDGGVVIVTDEDAAASSNCPGYATPTTPAACHACSATPCQANGCFGGYYCNLSLTRCVPKPAGC